MATTRAIGRLIKAIRPTTTAVRPARLCRRAALVTTGLMHWSRVASLVAPGAIAVGYLAIGIGYPSIAGADPNNGNGPGGEWDIGIYDNCMKNHPTAGLTLDEQYDQQRFCCDTSGGVWTSHGCTAPAGQASTPYNPGHPPQRVSPPNMQAPPAPVNPTAPVNPGKSG